LRRLLQEQGALTQKLVDEAPDVSCSVTYARRFGSLSEAFEKIGYSGSRLGRIGTRRTVRNLRDEVIRQIVAANPTGIARVQPDGHFRPRLRIYESLVSVVVCRCLESDDGDFRWGLGPILGEPSRAALVIRLNPGNQSVMDLFVVPETHPRSRYELRIDDPKLRRGKKLSCVADFSSAIDLMRRDRKPRSDGKAHE
jgi:hypothetical protein